MSWSAFKGYWGEKLDKVTETCKPAYGSVYIEANFMKWTKDHFSPKRGIKFVKESVDAYNSGKGGSINRALVGAYSTANNVHSLLKKKSMTALGKFF
ncbi:hypothetical protein IJS77_03530 [bacterium]|nr:hypothetical protein [bacterium]